MILAYRFSITASIVGYIEAKPRLLALLQEAPPHVKADVDLLLCVRMYVCMYVCISIYLSMYIYSIVY